MATDTPMLGDGSFVASSAMDDQRTHSKSFLEKMKNDDYRFKFIHSLSLCFAFWAFGFQVGQRGPSFLDIQLITGTDVERASTFYTAGAVGYLCGSLVSGILYDKFNKTLLLSISIVCLAITVITMPLCTPYGIMLFMFWINAFSMGWLDTVKKYNGANACLVTLWNEEEGRPYMQAAHFAFAFGGVISPLVTEPFLAKKPEELPVNVSMTSESWTSASATLDINTTLSPNNIINTTNTYNFTGASTPIETRLLYAYTISGILNLMSALPFIVIFVRDLSRRRNGSPKAKKGNKTGKRDLPLVYYITTIVILNLMYLLYCSVEDSFCGYLLTFVVLHLKWTKSQGSQLTSTFWSAFAASRFSGIFFVRFLRPSIMLLICMLSLICSLVGFMLCSHFFVEEGIWVFTVLVGLSMSVLFPTGFSWANENLFKMTGKITSLILISAASGGMMNPIIIGYLMEEVSPMWYSYLMVAESVACLCVYFVLYSFARFVLSKVRNPAEEDNNVNDSSANQLLDTKEKNVVIS